MTQPPQQQVALPSPLPSSPSLRRFYVIGFIALMAFDTLAQISFKMAGEHALPVEATSGWLLRVFGQPWIYGAFVGYIGAFFTWMTLLKHAPIGPAFAASHLEILSVLMLSGWLFGEQIGPLQWAGGALIVAGVVCLSFSESEEAATATAAVAGAGSSSGGSTGDDAGFGEGGGDSTRPSA